MDIGTHSTAEQMDSDPSGRLTALYEFFTGHGFASRLEAFIIYQLPRAILMSVLGTVVIGG